MFKLLQQLNVLLVGLLFFCLVHLMIENGLAAKENELLNLPQEKTIVMIIHADKPTVTCEFFNGRNHKFTYSLCYVKIICKHIDYSQQHKIHSSAILLIKEKTKPFP